MRRSRRWGSIVCCSRTLGPDGTRPERGPTANRVPSPSHVVFGYIGSWKMVDTTMYKAAMLLAFISWLGCHPCLAKESDQAGTVLRYTHMLKDPRSDVRREAIRELRKLSCRIHRSGNMRIVRPADYNAKEAEQLIRAQLANRNAGTAEAKAKRADRVGRKVPLVGGPDFAPEIEGLVPHLIEAANDPDEGNRSLALFALADTRDPLAEQALRNRLEDPSAEVRFAAACLLSEFQDAAALPELKAALDRFQTKAEPDGPLYYARARRLLASFERITGKSFGDIPPDPLMLGDRRNVPRVHQRYVALLRRWAAWWAWQPEDGEQ